MKAAAEIPLERVCAAIADWPERLKACMGQRVTILSEIIMNKT